MGPAAMLEQIDALPGPERECARDDGNGQLNARERRPKVGGHVVGPLVVVGVARGILRRDSLEEGFEEADIQRGIRVYKAVGCGQCTDGYKGRMGIYQVMPVTETIGRIIMEGGGAIQIGDQAAKDGIWNLRRSGLEKVRNGVTSLEEVNSVTVE